MRRTLAFFSGHLFHHARFYAAAALGLAVYGVMVLLHSRVAASAAGDTFFAAYLAAALFVLLRSTRTHMQERAQTEDEGIMIVVVIALLVMAINIVGVFVALNQHTRPDTLSLIVVLAPAPLGWFVLHTLSAFHYANLHYFNAGEGNAGTALAFPGEKEPDLWDFVYFSLVIGMTAQVSDVQVQTTAMRRAVTGHAVISFFFNTVLIAMAVNAAVANAG
jgi:uncharacterized membrane protein